MFTDSMESYAEQLHIVIIGFYLGQVAELVDAVHGILSRESRSQITGSNPVLTTFFHNKL
jgi:hypothetical protein